MCSEFDIPQKSVLLTTLPNLNDYKNRQIYEIRLQSCVKPRPLPSVTCQSKSPPLPETWTLRLRALTQLLAWLLARRLTQLTG